MTRPWDQIRDHYSKDARVAVMFELVTSIGNSRYAQGLHAWTSMYDLCVVQTPVEHPYRGPYLRISLRPGNQLEFRYVDTPTTEKQWTRTVDGGDGFGRLERFIEQLHWFGGDRARPLPLVI